jgi:peptide/nickel transport system ATP-binding protein
MSNLEFSMSGEHTDNALEIEDLRVSFDTEEGEVFAVDGVSFAMRRGQILGLVGESGCGKSVTAYSILRLIQSPGRIASGTIRFHPNPTTSSPSPGNQSQTANRKSQIANRKSVAALARQPQIPSIDITSLDDRSDALYSLRGGAISMIFQEPMTALSPVHTVGNQIGEAILLHQDVTPQEAERRAIEMLGKVGIPGAERRIHQYPFEMSGGMRQRVVIAMALVCNPEILIADEPTTALDVTIQAQIMALMKGLQRDMGTSILLITHDLGVIAQMADDVAVMYLGRIVEQASVREVMKRPRHPYTMGLLASLPSLSMDKEELPSIEGSVPSLTEIPPGCPFHPRCPHHEPGRCDIGNPPSLRNLAENHSAACLRADEIEKKTTQ